MAEQHSDQEFIEYVVRAIVNHPEDVSSDRTVDEMGVLLTLKVNPEDMGYVIGRSGQTARSLRTLLKIVGAKNNARVNLKIYEPEGSRRPPRREMSGTTLSNGMSNPMTAHEDVSTEMVDDLKI